MVDALGLAHEVAGRLSEAREVRVVGEGVAAA